MSVKSGTRRPDAPPAAAGTAAKQKQASPVQLDEQRVRALTERLAFELYESRGHIDGYDVEDWLAAERQARARILAGED